MAKIAGIGAAIFLMAASPVSYAQTVVMESPTRLSMAEWNALTDFRIDLVKTALQLTPDQEKYWPAVEAAIRSRAKNRQARIEKVIETTGARAQESSIETLRTRDPIAFLNRRADALAQRSADLKQLASAWQPLYATLTPEQKRRMAAVTLFVLRDMSEAAEQRRMQLEDDE
jgi:hypothetical protein